MENGNTNNIIVSFQNWLRQLVYCTPMDNTILHGNTVYKYYKDIIKYFCNKKKC